MGYSPHLSYVGQSTEISLGCEGVCPNRRTLKFPLGAHALLATSADGVDMTVVETTTVTVDGVVNTILNQTNFKSNTCQNPCERGPRLEEISSTLIATANATVKLI